MVTTLLRPEFIPRNRMLIDSGVVAAWFTLRHTTEIPEIHFWFITSMNRVDLVNLKSIINGCSKISEQ